MTKVRSITKLYKKLYSTLVIYLLYEYSKRFAQPVVQLVVQTVVRPASKCKRTLIKSTPQNLSTAGAGQTEKLHA